MPELRDEEYVALEELRFRIRKFLRFSEEAAGGEGLEPQQHQMLLAVRALSAKCPEGPTVGTLAERLLIKHHSAVGMLDRLAERGLVERIRGGPDRRQVRLRLSAIGHEKLAHLSAIHHEELRQFAPQLVEALDAIGGRWALDPIQEENS